MNFSLMAESLPKILAGLPLTLELAVVSLGVGFGLAMLVALARLSANPLIAGLARAYVFVFRGTPLLVQIFLLYYGLGQFPLIRQSVLWTVFREPFWCAAVALTLNTGAYAGEIIRGGILAVPVGQIEAAKAVGMGRLLAFRRIIFPQAIRQALPAYSNEVILMIKGTSLASTVTLLEVTGIARGIISKTFAPVEIFIIAGGIYLALNFLITRLLYLVEWHLGAERRAAPEVAQLH